VVHRIYKEFIDGRSITAIVAGLNEDKVSSRKRKSWSVPTVSRILKAERYRGRFHWGRTARVKEPLTGKVKVIPRKQEEWVTLEQAELKIISDEVWAEAQKRWQEIEGVFPRGKKVKGFQGKRTSYVTSHPPHLLSGALSCGLCGSAINLVSGTAKRGQGGYYGCLQAVRRACTNRVLIARNKLEARVLAVLRAEVLRPDVLHAVYERTAAKVKEQFSHVPEELKAKRTELASAETRVHHFIEFIARGKAPTALADALADAEGRVKTLKVDVLSLEAARVEAFEPPPEAWIADRLAHLEDVLALRTEQSALALRRLLGNVKMTPQKPEVGRSYYTLTCAFQALNLLDLVKDAGNVGQAVGSNLLQWWRAEYSKPSGL